MINNSNQSIGFYEKEAEVYDKRRWRSKAGQYIDNVQKTIVLDLIGDCVGKNVLDIATGTGRFAIELAKKGANVTVLDSSKAMLRIVKAKFENEQMTHRLTIHHGLATEMPFKNGVYDICICINAMNHIPGYGKVAKEIGRVLDSKGLSITNYTNWLSCYLPIGVLANLRQKSVSRDVYTKWFRLCELQCLHSKNRLDVKEVVGAVQFPSKISNYILLGFFKGLDRKSRSSLLRYFAPMLFIKARKMAPLGKYV